MNNKLISLKKSKVIMVESKDQSDNLYEEADLEMKNVDWNDKKQKAFEKHRKALKIEEVETKLKAVFDAMSEIILFTKMNPEEISDYLSEFYPEKYEKWCKEDQNPIHDLFFP